MIHYTFAAATLILATAIVTDRNDDSPYGGHLTKEVCDLFTPMEYRFTGGRYVDKIFRYRLFEPEYDRRKSKYPLIVWLHGYGDLEINGPTNLGQLKWMDDIFTTAKRKDYPFFFLAMQCPKDMPRWYDYHGLTKEDGDSPMSVLWEIIQKTIHDYPVDEDRVCLTGISGGGSGAWEMAMRYPNFFAAIAPIASGGGDVSRAGKLRNTPVWAFHSKGDGPEGDRRMVTAVNRLGGKALLTEVNGASHFCWGPAFEFYHLLPWLLAQNRSENSVRPGVLPWKFRVRESIRDGQWWKYVAVLLAGPLIVAAWFSERRRRRALMAEPQPAAKEE